MCRSMKNAFDMGLISQIPVPEEVANHLTNEDLSNAHNLIDKTVSTFKVSRRYSVEPHNKKHLFGKKGILKDPKPLEKKFYE